MSRYLAYFGLDRRRKAVALTRAGLDHALPLMIISECLMDLPDTPRYHSLLDEDSRPSVRQEFFACHQTVRVLHKI